MTRSGYPCLEGEDTSASAIFVCVRAHACAFACAFARAFCDHCAQASSVFRICFTLSASFANVCLPSVWWISARPRRVRRDEFHCLRTSIAIVCPLMPCLCVHGDRYHHHHHHHHQYHQTLRNLKTTRGCDALESQRCVE